MDRNTYDEYLGRIEIWKEVDRNMWKEYLGRG